MNIAPMSEPNTMIPAQRGDPEDPAAGDVEVVERVRARRCRRTKATPAARAIAAETEHERPLVGHRREVDGRGSSAPTSSDREDAAEVVDRVGGLVHVARHEAGAP